MKNTLLFALALHVSLSTRLAAAISPVAEITGAFDNAVRRLPGASVLEATLPQALAGSDLRLQLVSWKGRYLGGRAWVDGQDSLPRAVWVVEDTGTAVRVSIGMPGECTPKGTTCEGCVFDLALTESAGKITGSFKTAGVETDLLPLAPASGTLSGRRGGPLASPHMRAGHAVEVLPGAADLLRLYRALDLVVAQGVAPADAWKAARVIVPDGYPQKTPAAHPNPGPKWPSLQDTGEKPKSPAKSESSVVEESKLALARETLVRLGAAVSAWAPGATVSRDTSADPDFGPWYGHGCLATNASGSVLPADAAPSGSPLWLSVGPWRSVGPFPACLPAVVCRGLPEFFDNDNAQYATDLEALKRDGETPPATRLVSWQKVEDQIEVGLQRPWTRRNPGGHGSTLAYTGPANGTTYAVAEIRAEKDVELWVALGATDYGRLWVNDRLAAAAVDGPDAEERIAWGPAKFVAGRNRLVVRLDHANRWVGSGAKRRLEKGGLESHFWVKVAARGAPRASAGGAQAAPSLPANGVGYRNNNTACYPDAKPVTAWDLATGKNVLWRRHLELESAGGYGSNVNSSKAPPVAMGDRLIVLAEPHFVLCLDPATGNTLWQRECNVLEFTAPDKLDECRRRWAEYVSARAELMKLGRDSTEREANLLKLGMTKEQAKQEIKRVAGIVGEKAGNAKKPGAETFWGFFIEHGKFGRSAYGGWTGFSFASPVTDGEKIWVKFGTGVAACFDREGNRQWMVKIPAEGQYSVCPSPLLAGGKFIVEVGAKSERPGQERFGCEWTRFIGLDAVTGKEVWRSEPLFHPSATSSPVAMRIGNGREKMDVIVSDGAALLRADDGKILSQTWLVDAGLGSPTVGDGVVYHASEPGLLTASRPVMYDRDSAGLRRLWMHLLPTGFDAGLAFANGLLYGSGGGQGMGGYVVFDPRKRALLRHEWPGHGERCTVWRGMPPQSNGRQYVPITVAGDYVFIGEHGSVFHGPVARGAICGVMQRKPDGLLLGKSLVEKAWTAPPVFDGDKIYIRTDPSIVCIGHTGNEGRAYEADVNARHMLGDLETQPPADTPPIDIAPSGTAAPNHASPYATFLSFPMEVYGYFSLANADAVLTKIGGLAALPDRTKPGSNTWEVAGETITRQHIPNCGMYGRAALEGNLHFRDIPTGKAAYFRAYLNNDRERIVRVWAPHEPPDIWIAGQNVAEGTRVRLRPGVYTLVARVHHTEAWPVAPGFYFRLDDSSDVPAEQKAWREMLRASRPDLERIAAYAPKPAHVAKAKRLLAIPTDP